MDTDPVHWLPGSFFRKPEWRWLRAEYLITTGRRRDPRIDDDWVAHARAALRGRSGDKSMVAAVRAAWDIWHGDPMAKGELEARLLTEEPLDRIAEYLRLSLAVVEAYAEVFFAVRPMRRATDWLLTHAVEFSALRGFIGPQPAAAWKLAALVGGPLLLDVVIAATTDRPLPEGLLKGMGQRRDYHEARVRLLAQLWVSSMAAVTDEEFAFVVKARQQLRDLDARLTCRSATGTSWTAREALMASLLTAGSDRAGRTRCRTPSGSPANRSANGGGDCVLLDVQPPAVLDGAPLIGKQSVPVSRPPQRPISRSSHPAGESRPLRKAG